MLKTRLTGEAVGEFDEKIIAWIKRKRFKAEGHNMVIGIENRDTNVYRIIEVTGFVDFVEVMEFIRKLNFVDITDLPYARSKGYDGRFRYPDLVKKAKNRHKIDTRLH